MNHSYIKYHYLANHFNKDLKILGVDYGTKKVGFALYYNEINANVPLKVVINFKCIEDTIIKYTQEYCCAAIVIGICYTSNNAKNIVKLQKSLQNTLSLPVFLSNESLTTYMANDILKEIGFNKKIRNKSDDAIAACLILQEFIEDFKQWYFSIYK